MIRPSWEDIGGFRKERLIRIHTGKRFDEQTLPHDFKHLEDDLWFEWCLSVQSRKERRKNFVR